MNSSMIEMFVQPSGDQILVEPLDAFNFTWKVVYLEKNLLKIKLNFTQPTYISGTD